jgi:hypothetical protein
MKITHRYLFTRKPGDPAIRVSSEDYDLLLGYTWYLDGHGYAQTSILKAGRIRMDTPGRTLLGMHRLVMGLQYGDKRQVDHINGNTLDNRRENLRVCTQQQNMQNSKKRRTNTSGYKGVSWHKRDKKYRAQIRKDGKNKSLGCFDTPQEAHQAYCEASQELHGEFARAA